MRESLEHRGTNVSYDRLEAPNGHRLEAPNGDRLEAPNGDRLEALSYV